VWVKWESDCPASSRLCSKPSTTKKERKKEKITSLEGHGAGVIKVGTL
jgi:hypothetical protein